MNFYRIFLLRQGKITAHHEFSAENDDWARRAGAIAFDACSDYCDDFELWYGVQLVTSRAGLKTRPIAAATNGASAGADPTPMEERAIEGIAARILEAAPRENSALHDNPRLNARLGALRRSPAGPQ